MKIWLEQQDYHLLQLMDVDINYQLSSTYCTAHVCFDGCSACSFAEKKESFLPVVIQFQPPSEEDRVWMISLFDYPNHHIIRI